MLTALTVDDTQAMSADDRKMSFAALLAVMPLEDVGTIIASVYEEPDLEALDLLIQTHGLEEANI